MKSQFGSSIFRKLNSRVLLSNSCFYFGNSICGCLLSRKGLVAPRDLKGFDTAPCSDGDRGLLPRQNVASVAYNVAQCRLQRLHCRLQRLHRRLHFDAVANPYLRNYNVAYGAGGARAHADYLWTPVWCVLCLMQCPL